MQCTNRKKNNLSSTNQSRITGCKMQARGVTKYTKLLIIARMRTLMRAQFMKREIYDKQQGKSACAVRSNNREFTSYEGNRCSTLNKRPILVCKLVAQIVSSHHQSLIFKMLVCHLHVLWWHPDILSPTDFFWCVISPASCAVGSSLINNDLMYHVSSKSTPFASLFIYF